MNADLAISQPRGMKWYEIWWLVWGHPGEESFRTILKDPEASSKRGFLWVGVAGLVAGIASGMFIPSQIMSNVICYLLFIPLGAMLGLAIMAGVYRFVAGFFGGTGSWNRLVYSFAAIIAPSSLFTTLLSIPSLLLRFNPNSSSPGGLAVSAGLIQLLSFALGIYAFVLFLAALKGVEGVGTKKALAIYFTPALFGVVLSICLIGLISMGGSR